MLCMSLAHQEVAGSTVIIVDNDDALQDNVEDKWREQKAGGEEGGEQEVDEQGKPLTKKQRQQLKRAADKERAKQRQATQDRMEPQVAIPVF